MASADLNSLTIYDHLLPRNRSESPAIQHDHEEDHQSTLQDVRIFKRNRDTYHSAVLLLVFLATIGILLACFPIASNTHPHPKEVSVTIYVAVKLIKIVFRVLAIAMYCWCVKRKGVLKYREVFDVDLRTSPTDTEDALILNSDQRCSPPGCSPPLRQSFQDHMLLSGHGSQSSLRGAILVLGIGSLMKNIAVFIGSVYCLHILKRSVTLSEALAPICEVCYFSVVLSQMFFFKAYNKTGLQPRKSLHYVMALFIAIDVWSWTGMTIYPLVKDLAPKFADHYMCLHNQSSFLQVTYTWARYVRPMSVEYCTISICVLCHLWNKMALSGLSSKLNAGDAEEGTQPGHCNRQLLRNGYGSFLQHTTQLAFSHTVRKHKLVIFGSLTMGFSISILQLSINHYFTNERVGGVIIWLLTVCLFLPTTCLVIRYTRVLNFPILKSYSLGVNDYLLLFSSSFFYFIDLLRLVAAGGFIQSNTIMGYQMALFGVLISALLSLQISLQTKFLITVQRNCVTDARVKEEVAAFLLHLGIMNLFHWFTVSYAYESESEMFMPVLTEWFGSNNAYLKVILLICFPVGILYRFHSVVLAYELVKTRFF